MRCAYCRSRVFQSGAGRPKRWCSDRCRNRGRSRLRSLRGQLAQAEIAGLPVKAESLRPVSYTHLTLPTIYSV